MLVLIEIECEMLEFDYIKLHDHHQWSEYMLIAQQRNSENEQISKTVFS